MPGTHSQLGGLVGMVGGRGRRLDNIHLRVTYIHVCSILIGADAVVGHVLGGRGPVPKEQVIRRMKHSPGSGVLSVAVVPDGPTRILRVVDENKKVIFLCTFSSFFFSSL